MSAIMALPPSPGPSDAELLARVAAGDAAALADLFRRHRLAVHRFAVRLGGEPAAEDVVQQTFLLAWSQARSFRGSARVTTWLMGIAANVVRRNRRDETRRRAAFSLLDPEVMPGAPSPEREVAERELAARVPGAIASLPHDLRVAYVMCEVEGVPGTEAAKALGLRPGTLWRRLHDARRRLLALLEVP
jgi:RNA polymerase sigma-70 factor (ECF subfamily)